MIPDASHASSLVGDAGGDISARLVAALVEPDEAFFAADAHALASGQVCVRLAAAGVVLALAFAVVRVGGWGGHARSLTSIFVLGSRSCGDHSCGHGDGQEVLQVDHCERL